ncbi:MAG: hypothetical protein AAF602_01505 [Myxococcota bacterium]
MSALIDESGGFFSPALLTGTSSEFMGLRPMPRLLKQRHVVFVLGPPGVGKSSVSAVLAGDPYHSFDHREIDTMLLDRVRTAAWSSELLEPECLVLDGPVWLRNRAGAVALLAELAKRRAENGHRTILCQADSDGSIEELIAAMEAGSAVVIGLRFPTGKRARLRCARRICDELGFPRDAALGSEGLDPWRYDRLRAWLVERTWSTE